MSEPANGALPERPRRLRTSRIHPTGLVVAVGGLVLAVLAFTLTLLETGNREDRTLQRSADSLSEEIDAQLSQLDVLISAVRGGVVANQAADPQALDRVIGTRVEDSPLLSSAMVLIPREGQGLEFQAQAGESRFLGDAAAQDGEEAVAARISALSSLPEDSLQIIDSQRSGDRSITALATKVPTESTDWVIYVEIVSEPGLFDRMVSDEAGQPDFAAYLGEDESESDLLLSTTADLPLGGERTARGITIGEQPGVLVVSSSGDLLTQEQKLSPYFVLLAGLALTALLTPLVNRLASRREEVRHLSAQRDELDYALAVSREIEGELRASEQRFRSVLHSSPDVILWLDPERTAVQVLNRDSLLGHDPETVESTGALLALVHEDDRDRASVELERLRSAQAGSITEFECRIRSADGEWEWVRIRGGPVESPETDDTYVLAALTKITEQKREEERRAQLEQQLVQSQRLEAIGQLAGGVAHDFNNILAAILSGSELIVDEVSGQAREDVEEIHRTARRGSDLARQLLVFSRRDRGSAPEVVDLNEVISEVQVMLERTLEEPVTLELDLASDLDKVHIDPSQIERVLMNLTVNARDAMPDGGSVTIATRNVTADQDLAATRPDIEAGDYVELRVSDTGTGMPPEVIQRAFEPFFSTKAKGKGTGLGLATVYGIVQGAQGHIEIHSELDKGTTFVMLFPKTLLDARPVETTTPEEALAGGTERILVVEDEDAVRDMTRRLLEKRGYRVVVAESGAVASARADEEAFDLLLTDVLMPGGMNGREVANTVRKLQPRIGLLYMTGYGDEVLEDVGIDSGGEEALILRKPFTEEQLLRAVRVALTRVMEPAS